MWLPPTPSTQVRSCASAPRLAETSATEVTLPRNLFMHASVLPHESILSWKHFLILAISSVILTTSISVQNCPPLWCGLERCWNYLALSTEKPLLVSNHLEATNCSGTDRPHGLTAWPQQAHLTSPAPTISRVSLTTNISLSPIHILLTPRLFFLIKILFFSSLPGKFPIWPNSHDQILRPLQFIMKISSNHCW